MDLCSLPQAMSTAAQTPAKLDFSWMYLQDQESNNQELPQGSKISSNWS